MKFVEMNIKPTKVYDEQCWSQYGQILNWSSHKPKFDQDYPMQANIKENILFNSINRERYLTCLQVWLRKILTLR